MSIAVAIRCMHAYANKITAMTLPFVLESWSGWLLFRTKVISAHPKTGCGGLNLNFICRVYLLSIETRWLCSWKSDQHCSQNSVRVIFCLSKTEPCALISSQISSKFTESVYCHLCMPLLVVLMSMLSIVWDLGKSEVTDKGRFGHSIDRLPLRFSVTL